MNVENNSTETMDQRLREWLDELHRRMPDTIGDLFRMKLVRCSVEKGEYVFSCETLPWMCNPTGTLHGGITATILDQGMGMVANCMLQGAAVAPSVQLDIGYQRPLTPGGNIIMKVYTVSASKSLMSLRAEIFQEAQLDKICASATGTYFVKRLEK